jgi:hypothetical protein
MTKLGEYYKRLKQLHDQLAEEVRRPTDAADVEGAEFRLHGAHIVAVLEARLLNLYASLPSEDQAEMIKGYFV